MTSISNNRQYSLALQALTELAPELESSNSPMGVTGLDPQQPSLDNVLNEIGPLPREALFMGVAPDGLPILLNLFDPSPGPILVAGDPGAGKTALLQSIARGTMQMHDPEEVQFGVITNFPDEWQDFDQTRHCAGIFPVYHSSAMDFLYSLSGWAHANKGSHQTVLLLLDDLERMESVDFDVRQTLRWLLLRGPSRRVWPIITVNTERVSQVENWLEAFRTQMFGHVQKQVPVLMSREDAILFQTLQSGLQFVLKEDNDWLRFWIPA